MCVVAFRVVPPRLGVKMDVEESESELALSWWGARESAIADLARGSTVSF